MPRELKDIVETTAAKVELLIKEMDAIVTRLRNRRRLVEFREVDEFFYLQSIEELNLLRLQWEEIQNRLHQIDHRIKTKCDNVVARWKNDSKLLEEC